jgi:hypothetical protein
VVDLSTLNRWGLAYAPLIGRRDGVNAATRLEGLADPDGICVTIVFTLASVMRA